MGAKLKHLAAGISNIILVVAETLRGSPRLALSNCVMTYSTWIGLIEMCLLTLTSNPPPAAVANASCVCCRPLGALHAWAPPNKNCRYGVTRGNDAD